MFLAAIWLSFPTAKNVTINCAAVKFKTMGEIEYPNLLNGLRTQEAPTLKDLRNFEGQLSNERNKYLNKLQEFVTQLKEKLDTLKSEVRGDFNMEIRDAEYYRVNMFQLEGKISQLKQFIKIEMCNLIREEGELMKDLNTIERRLDEWGKPLNTRTLKAVVSSYIFTQSDENDPTNDFQRFLASYGGHTGGWDEQDHLLFLRERRKFHGKQKFIGVVHSFLPDISEDEIIAHDDWYRKYEELKKLQKEAIKKWRANRHAFGEKKQDSSQDENEQTDKMKPRNYAGQRDITERIKEWKRQQQIKKAEEEERIREEQLRQHEERQRKREAQKAKKVAVEKYKADKMSKLQEELLNQQMKELQILEDKAKKGVMLRAFREQDQQYVEKKRMQKLQNELKAKQREERLKRIKPIIEIERDPQRVLQPTQVWANRCSQQEDHNSAAPLGLHSIQHLSATGKIQRKQKIKKKKLDQSKKGVSWRYRRRATD